MTSCDMRPLRIVRPPPGRGVRGVLAPALAVPNLVVPKVTAHPSTANVPTSFDMAL